MRTAAIATMLCSVKTSFPKVVRSKGILEDRSVQANNKLLVQNPYGGCTPWTSGPLPGHADGKP